MTCSTSWWTCVDVMTDTQISRMRGFVSAMWSVVTSEHWVLRWHDVAAFYYFMRLYGSLWKQVAYWSRVIRQSSFADVLWDEMRTVGSRVSWHLNKSDCLITRYFVALNFDMTLTYYKYLITWMVSRRTGHVPAYKLRRPRQLLFKLETRKIWPFYRCSAARDLISETRNRRC